MNRGGPLGVVQRQHGFAQSIVSQHGRNLRRGIAIVICHDRCVRHLAPPRTAVYIAFTVEREIFP